MHDPKVWGLGVWRAEHRMRDTKFTVPAENDRETPGNPGLRAAHEAATRFHLPPGAARIFRWSGRADWN